jgi:hypothetical protein
MAMTTMIERMLAHAAQLEADAAALRRAAGILGGTAHAQKIAGQDRTLLRATQLRAEQLVAHANGNGNGHGPVPPVTAVPALSARSSHKAVEARRARKQHHILTLLRDHGKPMRLAELREAAAALGVSSLTGMAGYVRAGLLKRTGDGKNTRYRFVQMPDAD